MLSIVLYTQNSAEALARSLTALVPAVVDGVLRRVIVIDGGSQDQSLLVAEGMGCDVFPETKFKEALERISAAWVLLLQPGAILPDGWEAIARKHMEESKAPARFSLAKEKKMARLGWLFGRKPGLEAGLLAPIEVLRPILNNAADFEKAPRQLKSVRLPIVIQLPD